MTENNIFSGLQLLQTDRLIHHRSPMKISADLHVGYEFQAIQNRPWVPGKVKGRTRC